MTSKAERARTRKVANTIKAQAQPKPAGAAPVVKLTPLHRKSGIEWLLSKKRLTARQAFAGTCYGNDYRADAANGLEPLRSCLDDEVGGSSTSRLALSKAEYDTEARQRLALARAALSFHSHMVAVCDAVCGRGLTPREITPIQREAEKVEHTLVIALDLLVKHYQLTNYLKRA